MKQVTAEFEFAEHELETVFQAAVCLDRIEQARDEIAVHGILTVDRHGQLKPNPAVVIERDCKVLFARLCRELELFMGKNDPRIPRKE